MLVGSGGDGIFGNGNDVTLQSGGAALVREHGRGSILTINTAGLNLPTDEYELTLEGTGGNVIKNLQGNALDGENTPNDDPERSAAGPPLGHGHPGEQLLPPVHHRHACPLDRSGDLHARPVERHGESPLRHVEQHTILHGPDHRHLPAGQPAAGRHGLPRRLNQTTGQWVQVGQTTTNATGNFTVTASSPLPDTLYNVGPDGLLGTADDSSCDLARVRIVNQAGNASNAFTDPISAFEAEGAATDFIIDTLAPQVTAESPAPGSLVTPRDR